MSSEDSVGVTLAMVDPSLLSSWEAMVKRGEECSLMLKHSKGKINATLQCTTPTPSPARSSLPSLPLQQRRGKKERKQGEEAEGTSCLSPAPGGGERAASKQIDGGSG